MIANPENDGVYLWQEQASCKGVPSSIFFGEEGSAPNNKDYKAFCDGCPVKSHCLETALIYRYPGIWGGTTDKERSRMSTKASILREDFIDSGLYNVFLQA